MHTCICMPSQNIAVQREVYHALRKERRSGESFTVQLRRLLDGRAALSDLLGAWGGTGHAEDLAHLRRLRRLGRA